MSRAKAPRRYRQLTPSPPGPSLLPGGPGIPAPLVERDRDSCQSRDASANAAAAVLATASPGTRVTSRHRASPGTSVTSRTGPGPFLQVQGSPALHKVSGTVWQRFCVFALAAFLHNDPHQYTQKTEIHRIHMQINKQLRVYRKLRVYRCVHNRRNTTGENQCPGPPSRRRPPQGDLEST